MLDSAPKLNFGLESGERLNVHEMCAICNRLSNIALVLHCISFVHCLLLWYSRLCMNCGIKLRGGGGRVFVQIRYQLYPTASKKTKSFDTTTITLCFVCILFVDVLYCFCMAPPRLLQQSAASNGYHFQMDRGYGGINLPRSKQPTANSANHFHCCCCV